ncbi:ABC transporter ATP-binding protein [Corynebacterium rhinophilum]|uniref:ABC transporter ATP-binding protein n=1 Tax=Corynebacterium rhinophilum TaxID=3050197 RepID=UPI00254EA0F0|nr:ABC transporter ATP-binding protein [Corynebacterium sp. MSK293]MDK8766661.1 ABC transporter ATP-binding protein [Corynebacterium sp. MSK293]
MSDPLITSRTAITASNLTVGYARNTPILENIDVELPKGKVTTIVGPNGCGKSTLLRSLARLLPIESGTVMLGERDITELRRKDVATKISVLPQAPIAPEGLLVSDLVARGRHPHQSWLRQWSASDEQEVYSALTQTGSLQFAERSINELSGGQRQRVWISMVLAQDTEIMFLDEPTTYLDLATSIEILELIRSLRTKLGRSIVMVLHDLNLAIRYSDHLIAMNQGKILATGIPKEIVSPQLLLTAFNLNALVIEDPITGARSLSPPALIFSYATALTRLKPAADIDRKYKMPFTRALHW